MEEFDEVRLKKQMNFILEIDKLKLIIRQTYLADGSRKENDAEHSWHLAMMCMVLGEYANKKIDTYKTLCMVLIHDIVELDAGDTYAYDAAGYETKADREQKAAERIFGLLPEDQMLKMHNLWEEFEEGKTPEAKFANTLDKVQPLLLNDASQGKSWREHQVKEEQVRNRNINTKNGSQILWKVVDEIIQKNVENHNLDK